MSMYGDDARGWNCITYGQCTHLALDLDTAPVLKGVAGHQQGARSFAHLDAA